jgi:hypothetical protein
MWAGFSAPAVWGAHTRRPTAPDRCVCLFRLCATSYATKHLDGTTSYRLECWSLHWVVVVAGFMIKLGVLEQVTALMSVSLSAASEVVPIWGPVIPKNPPFPIAHSSTQKKSLRHTDGLYGTSHTNRSTLSTTLVTHEFSVSWPQPICVL